MDNITKLPWPTPMSMNRSASLNNLLIVVAVTLRVVGLFQYCTVLDRISMEFVDLRPGPQGECMFPNDPSV